MSRPAEIRLYDSDNVPVITSPRSMANQSGELFTRYTAVLPPSISLKSLGVILGKADEQFEIISELCAAQTVSHTWGVVPINRKTTENYAWLNSSSYRVRGGVLVATVAVISPTIAARIPATASQKLSEGVAAYNSKHAKSKWGLSDMNDRQFLYGTSKDSAKYAQDHHLVDIEPRFRRAPFCLPREIIRLF